MTYDLIVVGAGPGGCATAITAARLGANVLLIERGHFPRHKVCGEFVSAESLGVLASLLTLERRSLIANAPPIAYCRIFAEGTEIRAGISPVAASIARFDLDEALWQSALGSRVHVQPGCTVQEVQRVSRPDSYQPAFRVVTAAREFRARAVVNASGRWSSLTTAARRSGITGARWIGLKAHFREPAASASVDLYFFEGGYCGVQPVSPAGRNGSGSVVNACAMVKAEIARDMPQVLL
ncbi:MAG TPA: FAD-dependent oxidoreductase, partial [Terriglobales bacterium]|nr:FAD-dependent oxidoreductase [Terriglobales bacterium]